MLLRRIIMGPKTPLAPTRDSEPPKSNGSRPRPANDEYPGLEQLDRPELDELDEQDWENKSGVAYTPAQRPTGALPRTA